MVSVDDSNFLNKEEKLTSEILIPINKWVEFELCLWMLPTFFKRSEPDPVQHMARLTTIYLCISVQKYLAILIFGVN